MLALHCRYCTLYPNPIFPEFKCPILSSVLWSLKFGPLGLSQQDICWPAYDGLSQISEIFSSPARQLNCQGEVRLEVMREWSPVIITCVSVTVSQATNHCNLTLTSIISLVTRTLTEVTNNSQIPFLSIDPSFIWQVTCLLVVKKKQWESLQISRLCGRN